jgi:pimeloyl-ACP methyl ester carboxylesterase
MKVVFVHGACVTDASWWWNRMVEPLARHGIATTAVELPSCESGGDLHADADAVTAALDGEPTVLVGHSYGGMVVTDAAAGRPDVRHLVYLTAAVPAEGESLATLSGPTPAPFLDPSEDGTVGVKGEALPELFMQDCDAEAVRGALDRLTRQSLTAFGQAPRGIGWRTTPSTYVVCAEDRATLPARQREFAARAGRVVEIPTGHHPFLSHPDLFAQVIADITENVGGRG